jgi:formylglycine-generating enzyme required for sulfatase activity
MGSDEAGAKPDEQPVHKVYVDGFWMDRTEVTNEEFARFVRATGYVTDNEKWLESNAVMRTDPDKMEPGGMMFQPPPGTGTVDLCDHCLWWKFQKGANWRHPEGPGSSIEGKEKHPVVQVSWNDAKAYAEWAGKRLPTEAEWEYAARGGMPRMPYVWGEEKPEILGKRDQWPANIWQGRFPRENTLADGFEKTAPVGSFPANGYGLYDMAGNAWEWVADWYDHDYYQKSPSKNPQGPADMRDSYDPARPGEAQKVTRGGSYLCSDIYCTGYRPSARMKSAPVTGMVHTGFRCVKSPR